MATYLFNGRTANDAVAITKSATADNSFASIYVGGAGNVDVVTEAGTTVSFVAVPVGTILPIRTTNVLATSTATNMVGLR